MTSTMLILRGIASNDNTFGRPYPNGALDEASACEYARLRGYTPKVLTVSGEASRTSLQATLALKELRQDVSITALYGFSGGGYNIRHILRDAPRYILDRLKLVVVLGAPENPASLYRGGWELVYRNDPSPADGGHMAGPARLVEEYKSGKLYADWQAKQP